MWSEIAVCIMRIVQSRVLFLKHATNANYYQQLTLRLRDHEKPNFTFYFSEICLNVLKQEFVAWIFFYANKKDFLSFTHT